MRLWGILIAIGSLIGLFNSTHAADKEFSPHRVIETRFYDGRYDVKFHKTSDGRNVIMALDPKRLNLIKFDLIEARILNEERLVTNGKAPSVVTTMSSSSGEFWVAFARESRDGGRSIELHSDSRPEYFSIEDSSLPQELQLVEVEDELLLVATYSNSATVFRRSEGRLEQIAEIKSPSMHKAQAFVGKNDNLIIATLADQKVNGYELDREYEDLVPRFSRKVSASFMEATLGTNGEIVVALVNTGKKGEFVQIFNEGSQRLSKPLQIKTNAGQIRWLKSTSGQLRLTGFTTDKNNTSIYFINENGLERTVAAGDAKMISGLASIKVAKNNYVVYVKDQKDVYIQGDDAASVIRAPQKARAIRLSSTGKIDGDREVIAVMTDFDRSTRVQVIGFSRWREAKR